MLSSSNDITARVGSGSTREDGRIDNKQVIGAVHLGVEVHNRSTAEAAVVGANLVGAHPVVGAADAGGDGDGVDVLARGHGRGGVVPCQALDVVEGGAEVVQARDDGLLVVGVFEVGDVGDDGGEGGGDGHAAARGGAAAEVLGHGHGVAVGDVKGALDTGGPLELSDLAVGALDLLPEHGADVGGRLGENARAGGEVLVGVGGVGGGPGLVEVVEGRADVVVADDGVGVEVVIQVVANGEVDPRGVVDEVRAVEDRVLDDLELVGGTNTGAEEDLGTAESTGRENDTAGDILDLDDTLVATISEGLDLNGGNVAVGADHTLDDGVEPEVEVGAGLGGAKVGSQGAATLTTGEHVRGVGEGAVLAVRGVVSRDLLPASSPETASKDIETLLEVTLTILGRRVSAGNAGENPADGASNVLGLPAGREEVVPVERVRLEPETSVDSSATTEDATGHLVGISASNTVAVNPDLVAKTGDIEAGELSALKPLGLQGTAVLASGGNTLLNKENALARLAELISGGDTTGTTTNDNVVKGGASRNRHTDDTGLNGTTAVASDGLGSLSSPGSVGWVGNILVENGAPDAHTVVVLLEGDLIRASRVARRGESLNPTKNQEAAAGRGPTS